MQFISHVHNSNLIARYRLTSVNSNSKLLLEENPMRFRYLLWGTCGITRMYNFIFKNSAIFSSNKLRTDPYSGYTLSFIELELSERFPFHEEKKSRHARNLFWSRKRRRIGSRIVRMRQYRNHNISQRNCIDEPDENIFPAH